MTSEKVMLNLAPAHSATLLVALVLGGCFGPRLVEPETTVSPYPAPKLWAVLPMDNQSGVSFVDPARLADHVAQALQQIRGIEVVPVNRSLEAMARLNLARIDSVTQVHAVMQALDVDGVILGTVTAWDPYEPPRIGLSLSLYSRQIPPNGAFDPRALTYAPVSTALPGEVRFDQPVSQVSDVYDAANGTILLTLEHFAEGRTAPHSPSGWRRYLLNMDLYSQFVTHEAVRRLLREEQARLAGPASEARVDEPNRQWGD